jgi:recombination protein RecA
LANESMLAFLEKLDPKTRKRFQMAQDVNTEMLPSASLELNWATGGGFPRGAITTIYGNYSASKTALCLATIGKLQKLGYVCAFVDAEKSFKREWAIKLGVDVESLILVQKASFGAIVDEIRPLIEAGVDFLVWDSISMTIPEQFLDDKGNLNQFSGQKQIGAAARSTGVAINAMHYVNEKTAIVLISQTRVDMTGQHPQQRPTGGKSVEFGSAVMIRLTANGTESSQKKGKVFIGDQIHELPVGREVNFSVVKNKVGPPNRSSSYMFYYSDSDFGPVGIDNVAELVNLGKRYGVIRAAGAWSYFDAENLKWNGGDAMVKDLKADTALFARIEAQINMATTGEVKDEPVGEVQEPAEAIPGW